MIHLGAKKASFVLPGLGEMSFHYFTLIMTMLVSVILVVFSLFLCRSLTLRPSKKQSFAEMIVHGLYDLTSQSLGDDTKMFFPLIATTFLFVLVSSMVGVIPTLKGPTSDVNVCLSLAFTIFAIAHLCGIKKKGFIGYLKGFTKPFAFMLPLNIIGEISQVFSHAFRLFGNCFGGGIIFLLIPVVIFTVIQSFGAMNFLNLVFSEMGILDWFVYSAVSPIIVIIYFLAYSFFGMFSGLIQAFVFTLLALACIATQVND